LMPSSTSHAVVEVPERDSAPGASTLRECVIPFLMTVNPDAAQRFIDASAGEMQFRQLRKVWKSADGFNQRWGLPHPNELGSMITAMECDPEKIAGFDATEVECRRQLWDFNAPPTASFPKVLVASTRSAVRNVECAFWQATLIAALGLGGASPVPADRLNRLMSATYAFCDDSVAIAKRIELPMGISLWLGEGQDRIAEMKFYQYPSSTSQSTAGALCLRSRHFFGEILVSGANLHPDVVGSMLRHVQVTLRSRSTVSTGSDNRAWLTTTTLPNGSTIKQWIEDHAATLRPTNIGYAFIQPDCDSKAVQSALAAGREVPHQLTLIRVYGFNPPDVTRIAVMVQAHPTVQLSCEPRNGSTQTVQTKMQRHQWHHELMSEAAAQLPPPSS
jgi:hypothetical protein